MKAAIITAHRSCNYGGVLQPFALQKVFEKHGIECEFLDFFPEEATNRGKRKALKQKSRLMKNPVIYLGAFCAFGISYWWQKKVFDRFLYKYLKLSKVTYKEMADFEVNPVDADVFCAGGDQVFNGMVEPRYFPFVKDKPIVSYSASFGKDYVDKDIYEKEKNYLKRFELLSVREDSGIKILEEMGIHGAVHALDSTLLLDAQEWSIFVPKTRFDQKKNTYILTYNLHHDKFLDEYALRLGEEENLKVYHICMHWFEFNRKGNRVWCPEVETFLSLFKNAKYIICDSFHGTVFSILYRKNFLAVVPDVVGTRVTSIASQLELSNRLIYHGEEIEISKMKSEIDWDAVYQRLTEERRISHDYIERVKKLGEEY